MVRTKQNLTTSKANHETPKTTIEPTTNNKVSVFICPNYHVVVTNHYV